MNFCFYSARTFESWDWNTPLEVGIGGSETSHVEMAQRLARRGHSVWSFAPIGNEVDAQFVDPAGVPWTDVSEIKSDDFEPNSVAVIYRDPEAIDKLPEGIPAWLICQDVHYTNMTEERAKKLTRIVALCEEHADHLRAFYPYAADKVCVSSNGIRSELIRERMRAQQAGQIPARNPKRLMYASSPDRGLWFLLHIFSKVRELVPDAELHVFYGFNNLNKVGPKWQKAGFRYQAQMIEVRNQQMLEALNAPGVVHHGRIGQREIIDEWLQTGVWCHPSDFAETSCITCMDAQACGAVPITTPKWAIRENVQFGVMIEGNPETMAITRARYVLQLKALLEDQERQQKIRAEMMPWALDTFDWENFVTQWESWAAHDLGVSGGTKKSRAAGPSNLLHSRIEVKQALGTVAYMGGIQATVEPFTWAWGDLREFTTEALCGENEYIYADRSRYSLHDKARNELCERMAGDWIFMLDCDLAFEPDVCAHLVALMYRYDLDVVTGLYPYKNNPSLPILSHFNEETQRYEPIIAWDESKDLFEFGAGGGGLLLIRKRVLDRIRRELREEPFARTADVGEDFAFFDRCRKLGIKCHCAWRTQAGHLDFQSKMLDMKNLNRERFGFVERETGGFAVGDNQQLRKGA